MKRIIICIVLGFYSMGGCEHHSSCSGGGASGNSSPVVPAPGAVVLVGIGLLALAVKNRRR